MTSLHANGCSNVWERTDETHVSLRVTDENVCCVSSPGWLCSSWPSEACPEGGSGNVYGTYDERKGHAQGTIQQQ